MGEITPCKEGVSSERERMLEAIFRKTCACSLKVNLGDGSYTTFVGQGIDCVLRHVGTQGFIEELNARSLEKIPPAYRPFVAQCFSLEYLRKMEPQDGDLPNVTFPIELEGEWVWISILVICVEGVGGGRSVNILVRNATAEAEETTRRQKERDAAETSEAILKNIVNSLFGYFLTIDVETMKYKVVAGTGQENIVKFLSQHDDYNIAFNAKRGHLSEEGAKAFSTYFSPERLQAEARSGRRGFYKTLEHEGVVLGMRFWEEMSVYFGSDENGRRVVIAMIGDVTAAHDRIDAEREADRRANEAKSYFFSTVSHDIRTPLNAIVGYAELMKAGMESEQERTQALESIVSSGHLLKELVNDVLDLSKLESGKMEVHPEASDVAQLVQEVLGSFALLCRRTGVGLSSHVEGLPLLMVDAQRLRQMLFNLVGNSVKFTEKGEISVTARYEGGTLSLSVRDTGCGIDPKYHSLLMKPFVQVPAAGNHKGTGLGLAICNQLAARMGGMLMLESEVGKGSVFTISIPAPVASRERVPATGGEDAHTDEAHRLTVSPSEANILIVDDSPVNLKVLSALLSKIGCRSVHQAANGRIALEFLHQNKVDAVLTDMWMPEMDGSELIRQIRRRPDLHELPVYAVTADVETIKTSADQGFSGVLLKPLTIKVVSSVFAN